MSVNSSSSNDSLLHPNLSSNNDNSPSFLFCYVNPPSSFIFTSFFITNIILLLPLCLFIIHHGLQQWRQKRSTSSAATMSHSDSFTYNMVIMELIGLLGCLLYCFGVYSVHLNIIIVGIFLQSFTWFGEMPFHVLTCVERYLAVVHPITYLSLRKERGIRIRNINIGCVWLISIVGTVLLLKENVLIVLFFCFLIPSMAITSFCSVSVLRVLIRPGPGEQGGGRERVDQSKQRAFYTIMIILGVLVLRFAWNLVWTVLNLLDWGEDCLIMTTGVWSNLPSSLVLPLLFLHRAGKLMCRKNNNQLAQGQDLQD